MDKMKLPELKAEARKRKIKGFSTMRKAELLAALQGGAKKKPEKQSSLGPVPFNLVKQFMLEKKDDYDDLYFDYHMFSTLKDINLHSKGYSKREDVIKDFLKEIEIRKDKFPLEVRQDFYRWDLQTLEMPKKMTDDEIKAYYAKFGFVVEPHMWSPKIYVDESKNPPPRRSVKLIKMEDDAPTKIAKYLGKKEGVKAKVAAKKAETKPKAKRCPKGSRKDKKTGKCV